MAQRIGTVRVRPRRRGRWLTIGVPVTAGLVLGIGSFLTLGVASLIGGGTLLAPLLAGLGIGVLVGGALGLALRNRRAAPVRLQDSGVVMPEGTLPALEGIVRTTRRRRRDLQRLVETGGDAHRRQGGAAAAGDAGAERRRVLELTARGAAVAAGGVAVVALLRREHGAVAALGGGGVGCGDERERDEGATEVCCHDV